MKISIIGLGSTARVLGAAALDAGHGVQVIGRDGVKATALAGELGADVAAGTTGDGAPTGDLVILAVPYASAASIVGDYGPALVGKVVVDITNPFDRTTFTDLVTPRSSSGAEEAKQSVASFIDTLGLRPLDTGPLRYAHWLEGAGLLVLGQAQRQQNSSVALAVLG